jgi:hypothetical protein
MGDQKRRFEEHRAARKIEISILEEKIGQSQRRSRETLRKARPQQLSSTA